ncbi:MAG: DUF547 domain-containing protein [Xanthomonadales bacterium]|nr:DUF547 domain-containing protein [Xanthomonadales bacterium]
MIPNLRPTAILLAGLTWSMTTCAQAPETLFEPYAEVLQRHVVEHDLDGGGLVSSFDYAAAMASETSRELIAAQRRRLARFDPDGLDTRESAVAFWINAYNFFMLAHLVDNPDDGAPVDSVKDYGSLFSPYRIFKRELFDVGGRNFALSEIELDVLLGDDFEQRGWKDARVHFAVNCASVGCPALRDRPYTAGNLDDLLDENTRRALATPLNLRFEDDSAWLTSLFDWYEGDFEQAAGSVRDFIAEHVDDETRLKLEAAEQIRHIDYDWQLNSPANISRWLESNR